MGFCKNLDLGNLNQYSALSNFFKFCSTNWELTNNYTEEGIQSEENKLYRNIFMHNQPLITNSSSIHSYRPLKDYYYILNLL